MEPYYTDQLVQHAIEKVLQSASETFGVYREYKELPVLLAMIQASATIHQTYHWTEYGEEFYSKHLLFEKLYNNSFEGIDPLAERIVGLTTTGNMLRPEKLLNLQYMVVEMVEQLDNVGGTERSYAIEMIVLAMIKKIVSLYENQDRLTDGLSNLLDELASKHEENVYLLDRTRIKTMVSNVLVKYDTLTSQHQSHN